MPKWSDFGNIWTTLRELDVSAIRAEAERPFSIACVGHAAAVDAVDMLLHTGDDRYGLSGLNPIEHIVFDQAATRAASIRSAALVLIALDARTPIEQHEADALEQAERAGIPTLVVVVFGTALPSGAMLPPVVASTAAVVPDPTALGAAEKFGNQIMERLPGELQLAAARRLPGLRVAYARDLINSSSFTNATYAIGTSLPEQIPVLNVPFALADVIVLTKNQAIMVYRLALAYGAKPEFQERVIEVAPVIGGGFLWRQLARTLVSLVPVWGVVPKVAIAYGGTYATGVAAWGWFARGEALSAERIRKITDEAMAVGRQRAKELSDRARQFQPKRKSASNKALPVPADTVESVGAKPSLFERIRRRLPGQHNQSTPKSKE